MRLADSKSTPPELVRHIGDDTPQIIELEQTILGQMIGFGATVPAFRAAQLDPADFYRKVHRDVCRAIFALADEGLVPDPSHGRPEA